MNPPPEGWHLVLEFVKVLAGPSAAVLAVWVASLRAVHGFRAQKLIERRLDWYVEMMTTARAVVIALQRAVDQRESGADTTEAVATAAEEWNRAVAVTVGGVLWADARGAAAVIDYTEQLKRIDPPASAPREQIRALSTASQKLVTILVSEVRKDLRLKALPE
jgi:hypothetical protein